MLALAAAYERKAHEGRLIELEATGRSSPRKRLETLAALAFPREPANPTFDGDLDSVEHSFTGSAAPSQRKRLRKTGCRSTTRCTREQRELPPTARAASLLPARRRRAIPLR